MTNSQGLPDVVVVPDDEPVEVVVVVVDGVVEGEVVAVEGGLALGGAPGKELNKTDWSAVFITNLDLYFTFLVGLISFLFA